MHHLPCDVITSLFLSDENYNQFVRTNCRVSYSSVLHFFLDFLTINMSVDKRLFLTGATGLLGRAVYSTFIKKEWNVYGVAWSRTKEGLNKVDITDKEAISRAISDYKPTFVIHSAAQRYPDMVDKNPTEAEIINVRASEYIAAEAAKIGVPVLYISTDYVFDGKSPPYSVDAKPNPVNLYGKLKLLGEEATAAANPDSLILRVPVLYGPVEKLSESAVTVLLETLLNVTDQKSVSDYERRCPSHVNDIAEICHQLANAVVKGQDLKGIFHWCGAEVFTKYQMVVRMSELFDLPRSHILPDSSQGSSVTRPYDTKLDISRLSQLGFGHHTPFSEGIHSALSPWVKNK